MDTGLDRSIPHIGVIMEKTDTSEYPRCALPAGYVFTYYKPGFEVQWAALHYEIGQFAYMGEKPENWRAADFTIDTAEAWKMIYGKINQYGIK